MANFIAVVDPDPERRARFLASVATGLAFLPGLRSGACDTRDFGVRWAAGARAPLASHEAPCDAAVLFGDAIDGERGERLDAAGLRAHWRGDAAGGVPPVLDGYHAGVVYDARRGVVAGADLLGWYPVYWFAADGVLLVASSPEPITRHPLCAAALDPAALAGVLLLNGLTTNHPLLAPVRRLAPGHLLAWTPGGGAREVRQYAPPTEWAGEDLPWTAYLERFEGVLAGAVRRHVGGDGRVGLLLSGGLDSRMLAGYLHRQGTAAEALTQGIDSDVEMRCAHGVARALGFAHRRLEVGAADMPRCAEVAAAWEQLAGGFSSVNAWGRVEALGALPDRVVAGYGFDHVLHANSITPRQALLTGAMPWEAAFAVRNGSGLPPALVERLLAPFGGRAVVAGVLDELAAAYHALARTDFRRYWAFALADRVRHHIGSVAWRAAFGAWPVLPVLDRRLLDAVAAMPVAAMSMRRLQNEIVATRFPRLAALPLDRGSLDSTPLRPSPLAQARARVGAALAPVTRPVVRRLRGERRYFARTYDFNSPAWRSVRQLAEPRRALLDGILDPGVLREVVPPPQATFHRVPGGATASGAKLLLGLMLWAEGRV